MTPLREISVLFARRDSVYKTLPSVDVWDAERDARKWPGGHPVVAHPPCRAWGRLRAFAHPLPGERELALWAVEQVRKWGGVLEHPYKSKLWIAAGLPEPGRNYDQFAGYSIGFPQFWLGHRAEKATWFYIVGCPPERLPAIPLVLGEPLFVIQSRKRRDHRPHVPKRERELTPLHCAQWLCELARNVEIRE